MAISKMASITEVKNELTMSHPQHALQLDKGKHLGIYHAECGGKVWQYETWQECGTCLKTWGKATDCAANYQTQNKTT